MFAERKLWKRKKKRHKFNSFLCPKLSVISGEKQFIMTSMQSTVRAFLLSLLCLILFIVNFGQQIMYCVPSIFSEFPRFLTYVTSTQLQFINVTSRRMHSLFSYWNDICWEMHRQNLNVQWATIFSILLQLVSTGWIRCFMYTSKPFFQIQFIFQG